MHQTRAGCTRLHRVRLTPTPWPAPTHELVCSSDVERAGGDHARGSRGWVSCGRPSAVLAVKWAYSGCGKAGALFNVHLYSTCLSPVLDKRDLHSTTCYLGQLVLSLCGEPLCSHDRITHVQRAGWFGVRRSESDRWGGRSLAALAGATGLRSRSVQRVGSCVSWV
jgi:hypothetical protein